MRYLIDGYNLLFFQDESKSSLRSQRQNVVQLLQKEFSHLGLEGIVIFDGSHQADEQSGLSYKSPLVIAYSPKGQTADQYILEKLESAKIPSDITVVTNDKSLASQARALGAHSSTLKMFYSQLERKHKKKNVDEKKPSQSSKRELDRLAKIFEQRIDENEK